jgi:hypothetical protein
MLVSEITNDNTEFAILLGKSKELFSSLLFEQITLENSASDTITKNKD